MCAPYRLDWLVTIAACNFVWQSVDACATNSAFLYITRSVLLSVMSNWACAIPMSNDVVMCYASGVVFSRHLGAAPI